MNGYVVAAYLVTVGGIGSYAVRTSLRLRKRTDQAAVIALNYQESEEKA